jgi:hypothetical protein
MSFKIKQPRIKASQANKAGELSGRIEIADPLIIMFNEERNMICRLHIPDDYTHETYGIIICDLVRHIAKAFKVDEDAVWAWVDAERDNPTSPINEHS